MLIAIVWACAFTADITSYTLGRRLGRRFLLAHGHLIELTPARQGQMERFLARHGGKTILPGRFIGPVRALAPFVARSSRMAARRFVPATFIPAGIWSAVFTILGYLFWQSFAQASAIARQGTIAFIVLVLAIVGVVVAYRTIRTPGGRERLRAWARFSRRPKMGAGPHSSGGLDPVRCRSAQVARSSPITAKENS